MAVECFRGRRGEDVGDYDDSVSPTQSLDKSAPVDDGKEPNDQNGGDDGGSVGESNNLQFLNGKVIVGEKIKAPIMGALNNGTGDTLAAEISVETV